MSLRLAAEFEDGGGEVVEGGIGRMKILSALGSGFRLFGRRGGPKKS